MKYTDNDSTMATKMDRHAANIAAYVEAETIEELNIQLAAANERAERLAQALKNLMDRTERIDQHLLKNTGSVYEVELGEITQARAALADYAAREQP